MKKLQYILYILLAAVIIGLLVYDYMPDHIIESHTISKAIIVLVGIALGMLRTATNAHKQVSNKKALYSNAYGEFIGTAFAYDKKLEKLFYDAVDDFNQDKPAAAIDKLEKLRARYQRSDDLYAVTVFQAFCYDNMELYEKAIEKYYASLQIRANSIVASNMGLCQDKLGQLEQAEASYQQALLLDPQNHNAYNNLAQQSLRAGDYVHALEYSKQALAINPKMPQALNAATVSSYMLGDTSGYETYYRQAVSNGSDGNQIKAYIKSLDTRID